MSQPAKRLAAHPPKKRSPDEDYEDLKRRWVEEHPYSTAQEYERAIRDIAKKLNL